MDQIESEIKQVYAGSRKNKLDRNVRFVLMRKKSTKCSIILLLFVLSPSKILLLIDGPWGTYLLLNIKYLG